MKKVNYEEMLPHEFEGAIRQFPVAYVPVGSLEWHGRHLALGNEGHHPVRSGRDGLGGADSVHRFHTGG